MKHPRRVFTVLRPGRIRGRYAYFVKWRDLNCLEGSRKSASGRAKADSDLVITFRNSDMESHKLEPLWPLSQNRLII